MASVLEASSQGLTNVTFVTGYTDRALPCHTADPELFFSEDASEMAVAKSLCASCPLLASCLEGALARAEPWGIWGGELFDNGKVVAAKRRASFATSKTSWPCEMSARATSLPRPREPPVTTANAIAVTSSVTLVEIS